MNNIKIFNLLSTIFITCLISSCFDSSVKFSIKNAFKQNLSSLEVQNINFNNNQITVHGNNLNNVSSVTIKDNGQITNLNIVSKTENKIILQAAQSLAINAQKILEIVFSNANASSSVIQQIKFSMCDSTINNVQFDCSITPNEKEVLSYDAIKGWTPRAINGLSYKGAWSAITPLPDPDAFTNGDYFLVSVANPPYQVGDWIVVNEGSFDQIDNSSAIINVFGRTGAITAQKGDYNLNHLGDVLITSPATNQVLMFNGTNWVNRNLPVSGGGGGTINSDGYSAAGGGAGGMIYHSFAVVPGDTLSYTLGVGGAGGIGANGIGNLKGTNGTDTTLTYNALSLIGRGGIGGESNTSVNSLGGTYSGPPEASGVNGGNSPAVSGDQGGSSGGAIGNVIGLKNSSGGADGALSADFLQLKCRAQKAGYNLTGNGKASITNTNNGDQNHGSNATGLGCGGGSPGYWGSYGGDGYLGGGGAGAASYGAFNNGGKGGDGTIVISWDNL